MSNCSKLYDLTEIREMIPLSRAGVYLACKRGDIPTVKIGRRIFVPAWYIDEITTKGPLPKAN